MCIKNIYHNVYVDGEKDVTERIDACHTGDICSDPIKREFDRKINCTRSQLTITDFRPDVPVTIENGLLGSDSDSHEMHLTARGYGPNSPRPILTPSHPTPRYYHFPKAYSIDQRGRRRKTTTTGPPTLLGSRNRIVRHRRVHHPPSRSSMPSEISDEGEMLGKVKEAEDGEVLRSMMLQRGGEFVRNDNEATQGQLEQYSERYRIENYRQAASDTGLGVRESVRQSERAIEARLEQLRLERESTKEEQRRRMQENGRITEELKRITDLKDSSSFQDASIPDGKWDDIYSAHQDQAPADTVNNGLSMQTDAFLKEMLSKNRIAPTKAPTAPNIKIESPSGRSTKDDLAARHNRRQPRSAAQQAAQAAEDEQGWIEEEEAAAALLAVKTDTKDIYSTPLPTADDTSSIRSYNDSIFDDLESVLSSVSSLGGDETAVFVSAFVDLLIRDPSVDRIIARATSDAGIGAERFRRSFSRILKTYSRDLQDTIAQQQQKDHEHHRVVAFISRKTMQASSLVTTRYKERVPKPDNSALEKVAQYLDGLESDRSNSSDEEEASTVPTLAGLETFLLQGKPFQTLKWHLRSLIISNQRVAQVKDSAENLLSFMFCNLGLEEIFVRLNRHVPDFSTWLRLKIDVLATSLKTELKTSSPATEYLSIYSGYLTAQAVQKLGQKTVVSDTQHSESSSARQDKGKMHSTEIRPPEEILEDIMVARLPEVFGGEFSEPNAWATMSSTKSFREFASELSDAAYPTFFSESRKALKAEIDSQVHLLSDESEERYLLSILKELQCSTQHDRKISLSIESTCSVLWLDRLKLSIEKSSGSEWSWWPLSPPPRAESPGHFQLEPVDMRQQLSVPAVWLLPTVFVSIPYSICNKDFSFSSCLLLGIQFPHVISTGTKFTSSRQRTSWSLPAA